MPTRVRWALVITLPAALAGCEPSSSAARDPASAVVSSASEDGAAALDDTGRLRAAVLLGSCIPDDGVAGYLEALTYEARAEDGIYDAVLIRTPKCLAARTDGCAGVEACTGIVSDEGAGCEPSCTDDVLRVCDDGVRFRVDCAKLGMVCSPEAPACARPDAPPPERCAREDFTQSCEDNQPRVCLGDTVTTGLACAFGTTCRVLDDGGLTSAHCHGSGAACQSDEFSLLTLAARRGSACLDATTLDLCIGSRMHALDCARVQPGFTCQTDSTGAFCGLAAQCDPFETLAVCEGTTLVACNAGRLDRVDCTSLGFADCVANRRGAQCVAAPAAPR